MLRLAPADYAATLLQHPELRALALRNRVDAALGAREPPDVQVLGFAPTVTPPQAVQTEPEANVGGP